MRALYRRTLRLLQVSLRGVAYCSMASKLMFSFRLSVRIMDSEPQRTFLVISPYVLVLPPLLAGSIVDEIAQITELVAALQREE